MIFSQKQTILITTTSALALSGFTVTAFVAPSIGGIHKSVGGRSEESCLNMGLFDPWTAGGSKNNELDDAWEEQQELLRLRRAPTTERDKYFNKIEKRRQKASADQKDKWAWQTKKYKKGEDPIDEWKKRRANGQISDLEDQYGDPKKIGGIPLPGASFGVGGEFGVGGKFDNGGRFDLRLPYADQGYVDEDSDFMGKLGQMFGGKKKTEKKVVEEKREPPKRNKWPWEN